jgi:hypothetical protein
MPWEPRRAIAATAVTPSSGSSGTGRPAMSTQQFHHRTHAKREVDPYTDARMRNKEAVHTDARAHPVTDGRSGSVVRRRSPGDDLAVDNFCPEGKGKNEQLTTNAFPTSKSKRLGSLHP